jgi:acyl-CoA dehydrogenase
MDVMGGAGICRGPNNNFGNGYMAQPIAITVEGANILTRCLMIFGQGLNRAHPNLIHILNSIEKGNDQAGFMKEVYGLVGHFLTNMSRSIVKAVVRPMSKSDLSTYYEGQLARLAANFAVSVDLALVLGGKLKTEEMVSGRFADAFGTLYLGYACIWYYNRNRSVQGIDEVFELAMENLLAQNQAALRGVQENFPVPGIGTIMSTICFPLGMPFKGPTDAMRVKATRLITLESGIRNLLSEGIFISSNKEDRVRMLNDALPLVIKTDALLAKAKKEKRALTTEEQTQVDEVAKLVDRLVQVDVFDKLGLEKHQEEGYVRPALRHTRFAPEEKVPVPLRAAASRA